MDAFEEYQKEEYSHIAEAHFKTIDSISSFFRYYLTVMAVPLSILGALAAVVFKGDAKSESLVLSVKPALSAILFT